jgi:hypothetical protein
MGSHSLDYLPKDSLKILIFMEQKNKVYYGQKRSGYDYILDVFDYNYEKYNPKNNPTFPRNILCPIGWSEAFEYNVENTKINDNYLYWLEHNEEREEFEQTAYEDFKENHKFTEYLGKALESTNIIR